MYSETLYIPFTADNINLVHLKSSLLSSSTSTSSLSLRATPKESTISSIMLSSFQLIGFIHLGFQSSSNVDYIRKIKDLSSCLRTLGVSIIVLVALRPIKIKYSNLSNKLTGYIDIIIIKWIDMKTSTLTAASTASIANISNPEVTLTSRKKLNHVFVVNVKVRLNRNFDHKPNSFTIMNDNDYNMDMMPYQNIIVINKEKNILTYREAVALNISSYL
jgi:transcriptional regulator of aromatic amino acid metabolism